MAVLTSTQLGVLKAYVQANATAAAYLAAQDVSSLHAWCNAPASPNVMAWRVLVPPQESDEAPSYSTYDTLAAGKRDSWGRFLGFPRDYTKAKVRNWVEDIWGAAAAGNNAEKILQAGTERATNAQVALGGINRQTSTVTALDRAFPGLVEESDVNKMVV